MTYSQLAYLHLATIFPAFLIGAYILFNIKGTQIHKKLGQIYMLLILVSSFISLFMTAELGPQLFNHFGFIHVFSLLVLWCIPAAYMAAKQGNLQAHKGYMVGVYVGGILVAGSFTLMPGRMIHGWLFL